MFLFYFYPTTTTTKQINVAVMKRSKIQIEIQHCTGYLISLPVSIYMQLWLCDYDANAIHYFSKVQWKLVWRRDSSIKCFVMVLQ